jgi:hypothetical protein
MTEEHESDEILKRLRAEDPARGSDSEEPGERDAARSRAVRLIEDNPRPRRLPLLTSRRPSLIVGGIVVVVAIAVGVSLIVGGSGSGPAPALAIDKGERWIALKIEDPTASDAEMNSELAAAGIERVRVLSVPGPKYAVGTWAGDAEFGPKCKDGVTRFGSGVYAPPALPYSAENRHSAEGLIHLTVPKGGALAAQVAGTPYSQATLRVEGTSVNNPRDAATIVVPIRPRSPDDGPDANQIGVDQLLALGGVFAQYGQAIQDGPASCSDFGLKPLPPPAPFPPNTHDWLDLRVADTEAGAEEMTRAIKAAGIDGEVLLIPAQGVDVGRYLGLVKTPPLPPHHSGAGNRVDILQHASTGNLKPKGGELALRIAAFKAFGSDRWVFYLGRAPAPGEKPEVLLYNGPEDAVKALKAGCPGVPTIQEANGGRKYCVSSPSTQLPAP